ncbi:Eukaryotic translation initiation factor 5A [Mortierella alpina]|nr:Eukaryotic translation initiation factor 5A [Mortierella alpina]
MADADIFDSVDADAALVHSVPCSALRKNDLVVIRGRPCKIVDMSTSETGNAEINLVGLDIFTGTKYEDRSPSTRNMDVPYFKRNEYHLLDIAEGFFSLMSDGGVVREDVKIPAGELGRAIVADFEAGKSLLVTVISAMGEEAVISHKEVQKEG